MRPTDSPPTSMSKNTLGLAAEANVREKARVAGRDEAAVNAVAVRAAQSEVEARIMRMARTTMGTVDMRSLCGRWY